MTFPSFFYGIHLEIDPTRALIPRVETELLCERVDLFLKKENPYKKKTLIDLCTGSGALGLALKKKHPSFEVYLSDICPKALSLAQANAKLNALDVSFILGNLTDPFPSNGCDIVICNPPYISSDVYPLLDPSVREIEPEIALNGGEGGLFFFQELERTLPRILRPGSDLFFEIGYDQREALLQLFYKEHWKNISIEKDYSGHDRFFQCKFWPQ